MAQLVIQPVLLLIMQIGVPNNVNHAIQAAQLVLIPQHIALLATMVLAILYLAMYAIFQLAILVILHV